MNEHRFCRFHQLITLAILIAGLGYGNAIAAPTDPADDQEGVEVLTRGPVHEAFAETVTFDPEPGIVAPKTPPDAIEELPPDQKPEGANVAWIPGYWAWDDERDDFLWVSGIWRDLPPGRQWVPGYWSQSADGAQWTAGYWADATADETEYLPEPPATVESGPNIAAPSEDYIWAPGCWVWHQTRYAWRPGYWVMAQPNWTWIPAHYVWSPRGYIFVDGYHDYLVDNRGLLFAPVYFNASVYSQQGFFYSPAMVISTAVFANQLFLRPNYQHYYFGDYYAANYSSVGFHPWFSYNSGRYGYDPIFAQQRWQHRQNQGWERNLKADFQHRRDHQNARPPHTWADQKALMTKKGGPNRKDFVVAEPIDQLAKTKDRSQRFQSLDKQERQKLAKNGQEVQKFGQERQKLETRARGTSKTDLAKQSEPTRVKLPKSPVFAKTSGELGKDHTPPETHVAPKPDLKCEPKPRVTRSGEKSPPYTNKKFPADTKGRQLGESSQTQPKINQSTTQPKVDQPKTQRQPKVRQSYQSPPYTNKKFPADTKSRQLGDPSQSQPKVDRSMTQPKVNRSNQSPPYTSKKFPTDTKSGQLGEPTQTQPRVNRSYQSPPYTNKQFPTDTKSRQFGDPSQSQPKINRSMTQPQAQPRINQPQPRGNPAAPQRGSAGPPSAGPQSGKNNPKDKK